jgi:hypothetical protein
MDKYFLRAPTWVLAVMIGVYGAAVLGVLSWLLGDESGWWVAINALGGAVIVGPALTMALRPQWREQRRILEQQPDADWRAVRRAGAGGPVPSDPQIRATALELARYHFGRARQGRRWIPIFFGLCLIYAVARAIAGGGRAYFLLAAASAALIGFHWYTLRRLQRQIALLKSGRE